MRRREPSQGPEEENKVDKTAHFCPFCHFLLSLDPPVSPMVLHFPDRKGDSGQKGVKLSESAER